MEGVIDITKIGEINYNRHGSQMKIVGIGDKRNIYVEFTEHGNVVSTSYLNFKDGKVRNNYDKTVYGVGYIGEGMYKSQDGGKQSKIYRCWYSMFSRCYSEVYHIRRPNYKDCVVDSRWYSFQDFGEWYDENYYEIEGEEMALDKDILIKGNKIYSPDTCVFVPQRVNSLFTNSNSIRGDYPIGVSYNKRDKAFIAYSKDGKRNTIHLGYFSNEHDAFIAYKNYRESLIKSIADEYKDKIPTELYIALYNYTIEIDD